MCEGVHWPEEKYVGISYITEYIAYIQWRRKKCSCVLNEAYLTGRTQWLTVLGASPHNWNTMRKFHYSVHPLPPERLNMQCSTTTTTEEGIWSTAGFFLSIIHSVIHGIYYKAFIKIKVGSPKNACHGVKKPHKTQYKMDEIKFG